MEEPFIWATFFSSGFFSVTYLVMASSISESDGASRKYGEIDIKMFFQESGYSHSWLYMLPEYS